MEIIIFQLLSCLYLYDSGIQVPACIRKQSRSIDFWRLALIYRGGKACYNEEDQLKRGCLE